VTRSYPELGETKFAALVPERAFRQGANDVAIYAVAGNVLEELPGSDLTYALASGSLAASDGAAVPIRNPIKGGVRGTRSPTGATLGGWAANAKGSRPADSVVVLVDGKSVFTGRPGNITRKDILERYGVDNAGFIFRLPGSLLPAAGKEHSVRVFALSGAVATELRYLPGYPWATG
jgi:hypothetical protein